MQCGKINYKAIKTPIFLVDSVLIDANHSGKRMNIEQALNNMITQQLRTWDVLDNHILDIVREIPREKFVPQEYRLLAFADTSIPIGHDQTMMPPKEEARIVQELKIQPTDRALVLGTGSGYITALISMLASWVHSIDSIPFFTEQAKQTLAELNITNVTLLTGDMAHSWQKEAPWDVIVITGSLAYLPPYFREGLAIDGRLFAILGKKPVMEATLITRLSRDQWQIDKIFETVRPRLANFSESLQFQF